MAHLLIEPVCLLHLLGLKSLPLRLLLLIFFELEHLLLVVHILLLHHLLLLGALLVALVILILISLERRPVVILAHVVVCLAESIRCRLVHLVLVLGVALGLVAASLGSKYATSSSVGSLGSVSGVSQTFSFLNLLINMSQWILMLVVSALLLIKWSHTKLLMRKSLIFSSRRSLVFSARSQDLS
jgi:hypothetical protein